MSKDYKISQNHPNRQSHNWLVYDLSDKCLYNLKGHIKGHVYDLGCGEMPYKEWFLKHADKYTGVDWSLSIHDSKADIIADLNKELPIKSDSADTIVSISVMEHLKEPKTFLKEANRILKPGGNIVLQVPFMWWVHEAPYDYFRYTEYGLKYLFEEAKFKNIKIHPQSGFWSMWTLKFNYQSKRFIKGPKVIRSIINFLLNIVWHINQRIAPALDKYMKSPQETCGYYVTAKK
jgi:SAM-dependent methyltransferase